MVTAAASFALERVTGDNERATLCKTDACTFSIMTNFSPTVYRRQRPVSLLAVLLSFQATGPADASDGTSPAALLAGLTMLGSADAETWPYRAQLRN
jgi:hypothetical protein